jgi:hypothetical protein
MLAFVVDNSLFSTIPTSMGALSELTFLDLSKLWRILDHSVFNLLFSWLLHLVVCEGANDLSGTIPTELGALLALNVLGLGECLSSFPRAYSLRLLSFSLFPIVMLVSVQRSGRYRANRTRVFDKPDKLATS